MANRLPWFLSGEPDVLTLFDAQVEATVIGIRAFAAWAASGDDEHAHAVRDAEHRADRARRALADGLRKALVTPLDPEDLYTMSERLDAVLNGAKNTVRDADALGWKPDQSASEMASHVLDGTEHLARASRAIRNDPDGASKEADAATHCSRLVEKSYRAAIVALRSEPAEEPLAIVTTYEAYRSLLAISDAIVHVAHRIWYSVLKLS